MLIHRVSRSIRRWQSKRIAKGAWNCAPYRDRWYGQVLEIVAGDRS